MTSKTGEYKTIFWPKVRHLTWESVPQQYKQAKGDELLGLSLLLNRRISYNFG